VPRHKNQLRIIGGEHGGRRLHFPDGRGLRPTADRVRETLFNWLQGELHGRRVLDLFAGSGALGIEALSRGVAQVVFVERARPAAQQLRENLALLREEGRAEVVQDDAQRWLARDTREFDLVLLDPPFADGLLPGVCRQLEEEGHLGSGAWIYLEQDAKHPWPELPHNWQLHREGKAGQAAFRLMHRIG
jgi:16S rRNA (guanine966-N2)-methyltransferase